MVLDPKSVSSSGSFGPREEIQVKPADLRKDSVVPVVENLTQSNGESIKETVNMTLAAGQRCLLPIVICATNFELIWEFASTPKVSLSILIISSFRQTLRRHNCFTVAKKCFI